MLNEQYERVKNMIPTREELKELLLAYALKLLMEHRCDKIAQDLIKLLYEKFRSILDKAKNIIEGISKKLNAIYNKIKGIIDGIIPKIKKILAVAAKIVIVLDIVIKVATIVVNILGSLKRTSGLVSGLRMKILAAAEFICNLNNLIKGIGKSLGKYMSKAYEIVDVLKPLLTLVAKLLAEIMFLIGMLELIMLKLIQGCAASPEDPSDSGGGGDINENQLPSKLAEILDENEILQIDPNKAAELGENPFDYTNPYSDEYHAFIDELRSDGKEEVIERLYNANFQMIGYKRYKV